VTALAFTLDPTDAAVVALLRSPGNLRVQIGSVTDSDASTKTISATLPYVLFTSELPFGTSPRIGGNRANTTDFRVSYVNATADGCKAVAVAVRGLLDGAELAGIGRIRLRDRDEPMAVERDETWTRPGGGPLFFANDRYFIA
jgi:hypothetical protein